MTNEVDSRTGQRPARRLAFLRTLAIFDTVLIFGVAAIITYAGMSIGAVIALACCSVGVASYTVAAARTRR